MRINVTEQPSTLTAEYKNVSFPVTGPTETRLQFDPFKEHDTYPPCNNDCQWLCNDEESEEQYDI